MAKQFTLGRNERLKSRKAIERLFREGRHFTITGFRILYLLEPYADADAKGRNFLQAGVSVSSRNFKKAVDRNRIKRLIRESYRLQKNTLQEILKESGKQLQLFIIYTGRELPVFGMVSDKVHVILKKLEELIHENNTTHT